MKKTVLLSLALVLLLTLNPTSRVVAGQGLPVHLRRGGEVDNEVVNVRKSAGDEVVWVSDGDEFTISFPVNPFAASSFHVPAGGSASSGPVGSDASPDHYRYFITDKTDGRSADPSLIVKP